MKIEIIAFLIFGFNSFGILLLLLASLIVLKKRKSLGSILLCLFSIGFGCYQMANQLIEMLYLNGNSPQLQILILIGNLAGIITAPLLYFSIHLLLDKAFK
ncbi:MAG: hypothetical protein JXR63_02050, partial [Spirochaetales bacterium]|nr:hypothetical protein [Spirochaetales bacterium]